MKTGLDWLARHKNRVYLVVFWVLVAAPLGLYWSARSGQTALIWPLLALLALANMLSVFTR